MATNRHPLSSRSYAGPSYWNDVDLIAWRTASTFATRKLTNAPRFLPWNRHEGPVWQVSWAHPSFGNLIASCSYDHKVPASCLHVSACVQGSHPRMGTVFMFAPPRNQVIIWKEQPAPALFQIVHTSTSHKASGLSGDGGGGATTHETVVVCVCKSVFGTQTKVSSTHSPLYLPLFLVRSELDRLGTTGARLSVLILWLFRRRHYCYLVRCYVGNSLSLSHSDHLCS